MAVLTAWDCCPARSNSFGDKLVDEQGAKLKVPHMGWNNVQQTIDHPLWQGIEQGSPFYFVHSYYVDADATAPYCRSAATTDLTFAAALSHKNLFAVQFHPEKSADAGLQAVLRNFCHWMG